MQAFDDWRIEDHLSSVKVLHLGFGLSYGNTAHLRQRVKSARRDLHKPHVDGFIQYRTTRYKQSITTREGFRHLGGTLGPRRWGLGCTKTRGEVSR